MINETIDEHGQCVIMNNIGKAQSCGIVFGLTPEEINGIVDCEILLLRNGLWTVVMRRQKKNGKIISEEYFLDGDGETQKRPLKKTDICTI